MKFSGQSWNGSARHKQGVLTKFVCSCCSRKYKIEWARENHQRLCKEHWKEININ